MAGVPTTRVLRLGDAPVRSGGRYVLYWMIAQRRLRRSFALDRAAALARRLDRPLLVLEALRCDYEHASDRLHTFVLVGMGEHAAACARRGVRYLPYVEPERGAGRGLLRALAAHAACVVTDDHPVFHFPRMVEAARGHVPCAFEAVDGCGLLPIRSTPKAFATAHAFRRHLQAHLPDHLDDAPCADPLRGLGGLGRAEVPRDVLARWPMADARLADPDALVAGLPIDHAVRPVALSGGSGAGRRRMRAFVAERLDAYTQDRNHPDRDGASGLSPYLHFGHVGAHELFLEVVKHEGWSPERLATSKDGKSAGWWGMSASAEAFLDQFVTWRELGFTTCVHRPDEYASFASLPDWARATLGKHASDPRAHEYDLLELEAARTHDDVWNAAQRQLVREGTIHNYLRMLWGKKILHWSPSPQAALQVMLHLNDKYALDGRDPNSYSGILWCLGRHDRAWGPEREVFGTVRYMTSASTRRKLRLKNYLARFGPAANEEAPPA